MFRGARVMNRLSTLIALGLVVPALTGAEEQTGNQLAAVLVDSIATGEVYLYGHAIAAPYLFTIERDTLFLNGIPCVPSLRRDRREPPSVTATPIVQRSHALSLQAFDLQRRLEAEDAPVSTILNRMAEVIRADTSLVDSVGEVTGNAFWVWWRDGDREEILFVRSHPLPTRVEILRSSAASFAHALRRDSILIISSKASLTLSPNPPSRREKILAEIELARTIEPGVFDREGWSGRLIPAAMAREFCDPLPLGP